MKLIKSVELYNPKYYGKKDILIGGGRIVDIASKISLSSRNLDIIDCNGLIVIPGLIDNHIHIAGAGGEGGPRTRTHQLDKEDLLEAGITTVIGCLGTDGFTRNVQDVLMKCKSLRENGFSSWIYTGSYQFPPPSITGDIRKDICYIDEVIGVGEIAIADHRSSSPGIDEFVKFLKEVRLAGMLSNKAGLLNVHVGNEGDAFHFLEKVIKIANLGSSNLLPTHCNRSEEVFKRVLNYGKENIIDVTSSIKRNSESLSASKAVLRLLRNGVPIDNITISSDSCGSLPVFDKNGKLKKISTAKPITLFRELCNLMKEPEISKETALKTVTRNPANILQLNRKGEIEIDKDADMVVVDKDYNIRYNIVLGRIYKK